jgi:hypothetical protein
LPSFLHPSPKLEHRHPPCPHAASSRGPSRAPDAAPLRRFGSHHCRHLGLTVRSTSPGFSAQFFSAPHFPSIYQCSTRRPPPPPITAAHRRPPECRCPAPPLPTLRHAAASEPPHWYHLAWRFPLFALEQPPLVPPHPVIQLDVDSREGHVRDDHPVCASCRIDRPARLPLRPWAAVRDKPPRPLGQRPWAGSSSTLCPGF